MSVPIRVTPRGAPRVVVAHEDPQVVALVIETLRDEGYSVLHAYDALSAVEVALSLVRCDLFVTDTRVKGVPGIDLIRHLRDRLPQLPILYLANVGRSTPEIERQLPPDVLILREPFTAEGLRAAVRPLLDGREKPRKMSPA